MQWQTCLCLCVFPVESLYGEDLPLLQSGFISVTELVDAMSDTFDLKAAENDSGQPWVVSVLQDRGLPQTGGRYQVDDITSAAGSCSFNVNKSKSEQVI